MDDLLVSARRVERKQRLAQVLFECSLARPELGGGGIRVAKIGVRPGPSRNAALLALATEVSAAILSRKLGLTIDVAVSWQRLSAGDWMAYAATVSSRSSTKARTAKANS